MRILIVSIAALIGSAAAQETGDVAGSWDRVFSSEHPSYVRAPNAFLGSCVERMRSEGLAPEGARALVLAMGDGRNAVALARAGFDVTGLDISPVGIEKARAAAAAAGVELHAVQADLFQHDLGHEAWDLVTNIYFNPSIVILDRIKDAVKPGGLLVIEGYSSAHKGSGPPEWSRYKPDQLRKALADWQILQYDDGVFPCDWAGGRPAPVVRVLARKPPRAER